MILREFKVLDFTRLLPGPLATYWMAQAGAEVIKIEDAEKPDGIHAYSSGPLAAAHLFEALNYGKKVFNAYPLSGLASSTEFASMLASADVLVEQFKPGLMDKLGLGYGDLSVLNPRLIYVSLSGFGSGRPEPGHDLNFIAESGLLHLLRDSSGKPVIPRFQLGDVTGSHACYTAVLEAIIERSRTGKGSFREVNMTAALLPFASIPFRFAEADLHGMADFLAGTIPNYNVYRCADGEYLALGALEYHLWKNAAGALNMPETLLNAYNNPSMLPEMTDFFATKPLAQWLELAQGKNTCISPVCKPGDDHFNRINQSGIQEIETEDGKRIRVFTSPH